MGEASECTHKTCIDDSISRITEIIQSRRNKESERLVTENIYEKIKDTIRKTGEGELIVKSGERK